MATRSLDSVLFPPHRCQGLNSDLQASILPALLSSSECCASIPSCCGPSGGRHGPFSSLAFLQLPAFSAALFLPTLLAF